MASIRITGYDEVKKLDNKLSELKAAALAATPGPWSWKVDGFFYYLSPEGVNTPLERIIDDGSARGEYGETIEHDSPDARFIAAANPATVLALLAELEAKDREIDAANARVDVMCAKAMNLTERAETAEQRIAELEAIRSDASQVFKEIGSELGCNPDNESIMMAIDALKERLATPVRLPDGTGWASDPYNQGRNKGIHQCADAIRAAGFTV